MIDVLKLAADILGDAGFETHRVPVNERESLAFEDPTVLGFLFAYSDSGELLRAWEVDAHRAIADHQLALRRAGQKAWNLYIVLISVEAASHVQLAGLAAIEEDLAGTRKIARAHMQDTADLRAALLSLLPLQAAPKLEAVDIRTEIRERATELQSRALDAFFSPADDTVVLQVLEEAP
jgi:hypothetical protein